MEEGHIKKLMTSLKCTACGKYYQTSEVDVLGREDDLWFFKASCLACNAEFLVAAVLQESREQVTSSSTAPCEKKIAVTYDDTLGMHNFLKAFDGDFRRLFHSNLP